MFFATLFGTYSDYLYRVEWLSTAFKFCLIPTQILLLCFLLGYCDVIREFDTKRTQSVDDFRVNDTTEPLLQKQSLNQLPPTNFFARVEAQLEAVSKDISDGLQKKKKVHGYEYS
jgi:hypothetical protein